MEPTDSERQIRRLDVGDLAALQALRREALVRHPLAFLVCVEEDLLLDPVLGREALTNAKVSAVFGGFVGVRLVGMVGVHRQERRKIQHRAVIWGMYVTAAARRTGIGRALLAAAVEHARTWSGVIQVELSVSEAAIAARRLYESAGFQCWGQEPRALHWEQRFADEYHLAMQLDGEPR